MAGVIWAGLNDTAGSFEPGLTFFAGLVVASWSILLLVAAGASALWRKFQRA
jgi:hypothetical protein